MIGLAISSVGLWWPSRAEVLDCRFIDFVTLSIGQILTISIYTAFQAQFQSKMWLRFMNFVKNFKKLAVLLTFDYLNLRKKVLLKKKLDDKRKEKVFEYLSTFTNENHNISHIDHFLIKITFHLSNSRTDVKKAWEFWLVFLRKVRGCPAARKRLINFNTRITLVTATQSIAYL